MNTRSLSFLFPDENSVSGLKIFKEAGSSLTGFYFTKENFNRVREQAFSKNYAVYFLFNDSEDQTVYIGQSTNGVERIKQHIKSKDFWTYCILIVSDNNGFDHSVINYMEYYFIEEFKNTYYTLNNVLSKPVPMIGTFQEVTYKNYASQIKFLLEANGIYFASKKIKATNKLSFIAAKGREAELFIHDGVFFLSTGSLIRKPIESSQNWSDGGRFYQRYNKIFNTLVETGKAELISEQEARLLENIPYKAPSSPASVVSGYAENGYDFWIGLKEYKDKEMD